MGSSFRSQGSTATVMGSQSQSQRARSSQKGKAREPSPPPDSDDRLSQVEEEEQESDGRVGKYTGSTDVLQQASSKQRKHHRDAMVELSSDEDSDVYTPPPKRQVRISYYIPDLC